MDNLDKYLYSQIKNDNPKIEIDERIEENLMHKMQIKTAQSELRKNSFSPGLGLLAGSKSAGLKIGIAAAIFLSFFGYQQINSNVVLINSNDTAQVIPSSDSMLYNIKDSLHFN